MEKNKSLQFNPDYAVPPGETLLETIEHLGISQAELAKRVGKPRYLINEIIKGNSAITQEIASQLEIVLGVPASFWNSLERNYREILVKQQDSNNVEVRIGV